MKVNRPDSEVQAAMDEAALRQTAKELGIHVDAKFGKAKIIDLLLPLLCDQVRGAYGIAKEK